MACSRGVGASSGREMASTSARRDFGSTRARSAVGIVDAHAQMCSAILTITTRTHGANTGKPARSCPPYACFTIGVLFERYPPSIHRFGHCHLDTLTVQHQALVRELAPCTIHLFPNELVRNCAGFSTGILRTQDPKLAQHTCCVQRTDYMQETGAVHILDSLCTRIVQDFSHTAYTGQELCTPLLRNLFAHVINVPVVATIHV